VTERPADASDATLRAALAGLEARGPGRMVPDLERITRLCELLGDPQLAAPVVHVTATNGKGSVSRMVAALTEAVGLTTGTHTSPHLTDVRERLTVGGVPIDALAFAEVHTEVESLARLVDAELVERDGADADRVTYFELVTAMAFAWFADVPVDLAVIEVGMGGRWDATNVARAEVAVIGEVALDHRELGSTPAEVAAEKVGIIEPGSTVVSADHPPDVDAVVRAAVEAAGATWWRAGREVRLIDRRSHPAGQELDVEVVGRRIERIVLPLAGEHQARNCLLALGAFAAVLGDAFAAVDDAHVRRGLGAVHVPGRLETLAQDPTVVVDGAHNPHGARALASAIGDVVGRRPVTLVVGVLADKDVPGILDALAGLPAAVVATRAPDARGLAAAALADACRAAMPGVVVEAVDDPDAALDRALALAGPAGAVLATGSLRTVGAVRARYVADLDGPAPVVALAPEDGGLRTLLVALDGVEPQDAPEDGADAGLP